MKQVKVLILAITFWISLYSYSSHDNFFSKERMSRQLLESAKTGDFNELIMALDNGANFNTTDEEGNTALHLAALNGQEICIRILLSKSDKIEKENESGETALHLASSAGHLEIVKYLIGKNANTDAIDNLGETPLHHASRNGFSDCTNFLIEHFANPYIKNKCGWTPLHWALWTKNGACKNSLRYPHSEYEGIEEFLESYRQDLAKRLTSYKSYERQNAIYAFLVIISQEEVKKSCIEIIPSVLILLKNKEFTIKNYGFQALWILSESSQKNKDTLRERGLIPHLIKSLQSDKENSKKYIIKILESLSKNNITNQKSINQANGILPIISLFESKDKETFELAMTVFNRIVPNELIVPLIEQKIKKMSNPIPPLVSLLKNKKFLIRKTALTAIQSLVGFNNERQKPLYGLGAIFTLVEIFRSEDEGLAKKAMTLFNSLEPQKVRADLTKENLLLLEDRFEGESGERALLYAVSEGYLNVTNLLALLKVKLNALISNDVDREPALHLAVERQDINMIHTLLIANADVNAKSSDDRTALHESVNYGFLGVTKMLLSAKADTNIKNSDGWTPLHIAVKENRLDCAKVLLSHGADTTIKNQDFRTPCYWVDHGGINKKSECYLKRNELRKIFKALPRTKLQKYYYDLKKQKEKREKNEKFR